MSNIPKLRFKGFSGEWESKQLGDLAEKITKGTTPKFDGEGEVNYIKLENITKNGSIYPDKKISKVVHETYLKRSILKENDILYSIAGALGRSGIVTRELLPANTNQALAIIRLQGIDVYFTYSYLKRDYFINLIKQISTIGAQPNLSLKQISEIPIKNPEFREQEKIGNLFKNLDDLIENQEKVIKYRKDFKKSMLQKMFPKDGENVPEIRFSGFSGDWEEVKLGDYSRIRTGKLDANAMVSNGLYDFYTSGIEKYKIDYHAFEGPAITIAGNGATVGYMHLADGKFNAYQRTYVIDKIIADRMYLYYQIGKKLPRKIQQEARQGNIPYIVMSMLTDLKIKTPSPPEQEKIGQFFRNLDSKIDCDERLLLSYKDLKKSLLQKLFV